MKLPGKGIGWKDFFVALKDEYQRDKINDAAGALTFFGVLALFPFLLFLVSLASLIINPSDAQQLVQQVGKVAPSDVANILGDRIKALGQSNNVGLLSIGAIGAIWSASSGVAAVMRALNTAYDVEEGRPFWKVRGVAVLSVLVGGGLGLLAAVVMVVTPAFSHRFSGVVSTGILWLRIPVAALLAMLVWALAYYALPDVQQRFKFITPGSVVGVIVWLGASLGFSFYVSNFGKYDSTYGSLGGVIVMLLWMWISAQVLLMGAEINAVLEHHSKEGKQPGHKQLDNRDEVSVPRAHQAKSAPEPQRHRVSPAPEPVRTEHHRLHPSLPPHSVRVRPAARPAARPSAAGLLKRVGLAAGGGLLGAAVVRRRARTS